jgi:hypothetical protein
MTNEINILDHSFEDNELFYLIENWEGKQYQWISSEVIHEIINPNDFLGIFINYHY